MQASQAFKKPGESSQSVPEAWAREDIGLPRKVLSALLPAHRDPGEMSFSWVPPLSILQPSLPPRGKAKEVLKHEASRDR